MKNVQISLNIKLMNTTTIATLALLTVSNSTPFCGCDETVRHAPSHVSRQSIRHWTLILFEVHKSVTMPN
jgi:hypothetical protein